MDVKGPLLAQNSLADLENPDRSLANLNGAYLGTIQPGRANLFQSCVGPAVLTVIPDGNVFTIDTDSGNVFNCTLMADSHVAAPIHPYHHVNGHPGQLIRLRMFQDAAGGHACTWDASFDWGNGGTAPALSTAPGACDLLGFEWNEVYGAWMYLSAPFPQGYFGADPLYSLDPDPVQPILPGPLA